MRLTVCPLRLQALLKAEQLSLFGGPQTVQVRAHVRHTASGKLAAVKAHTMQHLTAHAGYATGDTEAGSTGSMREDDMTTKTTRIWHRHSQGYTTGQVVQLDAVWSVIVRAEAPRHQRGTEYTEDTGGLPEGSDGTTQTIHARPATDAEIATETARRASVEAAKRAIDPSARFQDFQAGGERVDSDAEVPAGLIWSSQASKPPINLAGGGADYSTATDAAGNTWARWTTSSYDDHRVVHAVQYATAEAADVDRKRRGSLESAKDRAFAIENHVDIEQARKDATTGYGDRARAARVLALLEADPDLASVHASYQQHLRAGRARYAGLVRQAVTDGRWTPEAAAELRALGDEHQPSPYAHWDRVPLDPEAGYDNVASGTGLLPHTREAIWAALRTPPLLAWALPLLLDPRGSSPFEAEATRSLITQLLGDLPEGRGPNSGVNHRWPYLDRLTAIYGPDPLIEADRASLVARELRTMSGKTAFAAVAAGRKGNLTEPWTRLAALETAAAHPDWVAALPKKAAAAIAELRASR